MWMNQAKLKILERFGSQDNFAFVSRTNRAKVSRTLNGLDTLSSAEEARWSKALGMSVDALREMLEASRPNIRRVFEEEASHGG